LTYKIEAVYSHRLNSCHVFTIFFNAVYECETNNSNKYLLAADGCIPGIGIFLFKKPSAMNIIRSIQNRIYEIRGERVMLDFDLAALYEVETKVFNQAVKRMASAFPTILCSGLLLKNGRVSGHKL
jgi:hypothetical protein